LAGYSDRREIPRFARDDEFLVGKKGVEVEAVIPTRGCARGESVRRGAEVSGGIVVGYHLVAALTLGAEHARVGKRKEASSVLAIIGKAGEADADGDLHLLGAMGNFDARVRDALTKCFELLASCLEIDFRKDDDKLFAAVAADGIALPEGFEKDGTEFAEDHIARSVAMVVIQAFETIHVDDGDGELLVVAASAGKFDSEAIVDVAAVEKARERIAGGELEEPLAAGNQSEAERGASEHHDEAGDLRGPTEQAVRIRSERDIVEIPVGGGEIDDGEIFGKGEKAGGDADAFVVTKASAANSEEISFENDFAVDGGVRFVEEKEKNEGGADEGDVEAAGGETEPRRIVFARDQEIDDGGENKCGSGETDADESLLWIHGEEERVDDGNEEKKSSEREADFGDEEFAGQASLSEDRVGAGPERLESRFKVHGDWRGSGWNRELGARHRWSVKTA
jgi:hypothetical protein